MTEQPLRILQVSTADIRGGAEKVAWNLFTSYRARGYGSWLAVGEKRSDDSDVLTIPNQEAHGGWYHSCRGFASRLERVEGTVGVGASLSRLARGLAEHPDASSIEW